MILPTVDEHGVPYLSSTQIDKFVTEKSFNLKVEGIIEYIAQYFLKAKFDDIGWAEFGHMVENGIITKDYSKFTPAEIETLKRIEAYELSQYEVKIDFGDFYLKGYIDTINSDKSKIKDFKTASNNSKDKYYKDDYKQIQYYGIGIKEETGTYPEMIVEIIEREGNAYRGGAGGLKVGNNIWKVEKYLTPELEEEIRKHIREVAEEISSYYQVFLKLNEI